MVPKLLYTACPGEVSDVDDIDDAPLPEPCCRCGRPASPYLDTTNGRLCFTCGDPDGPDAPTDPGARARWRDAVLTRTFWRVQAHRLARELPPALGTPGRG
jgi:hypothetical protein